MADQDEHEQSTLTPDQDAAVTRALIIDASVDIEADVEDVIRFAFDVSRERWEPFRRTFLEPLTFNRKLDVFRVALDLLDWSHRVPDLAQNLGVLRRSRNLAAHRRHHLRDDDPGSLFFLDGDQVIRVGWNDYVAIGEAAGAMSVLRAEAERQWMERHQDLRGFPHRSIG